MTRRIASTAAASLVLALAGSASAQDCPPGSWFCEDAGVQPPAQPGDPAAGQPGGPPPADDVAPDGAGDALDEDEVPPMPEPPPPPSADAPVRRVSPPRAGVKRWREKFGLNLRLQYAPIPDGLSDAWGGSFDEDPGLGGIGASFRWRPIRWFALDIGLDALGGVDYSGNDRFESAISSSGLFYLNPQHRVQAYLIAGVHLAHAEVDNEQFRPNLSEAGYTDEYDYVGAHGGVGVEFRVSRRVGIDIDGLALVRTRIDDGDFPEFLDPRTGETGDSNVGGLLRAGITIWF